MSKNGRATRVRDGVGEGKAKRREEKYTGEKMRREQPRTFKGLCHFKRRRSGRDDNVAVRAANLGTSFIESVPDGACIGP